MGINKKMLKSPNNLTSYQMALMTEVLEPDRSIDFAQREAILLDLRGKLHKKLTNISINIKAGKETACDTDQDKLEPEERKMINQLKKFQAVAKTTTTIFEQHKKSKNKIDWIQT